MDLATLSFWSRAAPDGQLQCDRGGTVCQGAHETSAARYANAGVCGCVCVVCYRIMQRL